MEADKELKSIINSGRIPNAFLFEGPAGSGKLKSAIGFAQSLFMLNSSNNNLNTNFNTNLAHPDFHIIFPIPNSEKKAENSCKPIAISTPPIPKEKSPAIKSPVVGSITRVK